MTSISPTSSPAFIQLAAELAATGVVSRQVDGGDGGGGSLGPELHLEHGTPQGQSYHKAGDGTEQFLTTYYSSDGVTLSLQDRSNGNETSAVLGGGDGYEAPTKGGGVATDGEFVYVADGGELYVYTRAEIEDAASQGRVAEPEYVDGDIAAGSFVEVKDGKLYVGNFNTPPDGPFEQYQGEPDLYQYTIEDGRLTDRKWLGDIPYYVQDVAITDDGVIYSRSYSNKEHSPHYLTEQKFDGNGQLEPVGNAKNVQEIPYYSEGISIVDGEVYVTHESGSLNENGNSSDTHVQRTRIEDFAVIDGPLDPPEVEPEHWWSRFF